DAGTLAHDEAIAFQIEGTTGPTRLDVARRDRPDGTKRGQRQGRDARFTATGDHRRRVAPPDGLERLADGVRPRGAGGDGAVVRSTGSERDRDLAGAHVRDHHRHGERTHPRGSPLLQDGVRLLDLFQPTDGAAHQYAHLVTIRLRALEPGLLE